MSTSSDEVAGFLKEFKRVALDRGKFYLVRRAERNKDIITLGLTRQNCIDEIVDLSVADYCKGPEADNDRAGEVWVFGKSIAGREVYIKLKVADVGCEKIAKCISFHVAEYPMCYPFKKGN